jgi:peptidyl-prolyl cis-trans isomerase D
MKSGSYIKALRVGDTWLTGKIDSINRPKPLSFDKAKEFAKSDLVKQKMIKSLDNKAKELVKSELKETKDLGFLSASDIDKIKDISKERAKLLLSKVFMDQKSKGYIISGNSAIIYEVKAQKLLDEDGFKKEKDRLLNNIKALKSDLVQRGLIDRLKNRYEIQQLVRFSNKKEG